MSAANEALARRFFEEFCNGRDDAVADEIIAPGWPAGVQEIHAAGDDRVVVRWIGRGTHQTEMMGAEPTGEPGTVDALTPASHRRRPDRRGVDGLAQQLAVVPVAA